MNEVQLALVLVAKALVVSLISATLIRLMTRERGPYALFAKYRSLALKLLQIGRVGRELHEALTCPICLTVWASLLGALVTLTPLVFLVSPILTWIFLEASGMPQLPDDSE